MTDGIKNQPRLILDQQIQDEIKNPSLTKKIVNQLLGLAGIFRRDSIQTAGKTPEVAAATEKGSYPYCPYETCKTAEDFSKFTVGKRSLDKKDETELTPSTQKEDFVSATEEVKETETEEKVTQTKKSDVNESIIKSEMEQLFQEFDQLSKDDQTNFSKLEELIRKYALLAARYMGITDEQFRESLKKSEKIEQEKTIRAINGPMSIGALCVGLAGAAVTGIGGGAIAGGFAAAGSAATAQTIGQICQVGQVATPVEKFMDTSARSQQTEHEYYVRRIDHYVQQSVENKRLDEQQQQQLKQAIDEMISKNHNTFSSIAASSSS